MKDYSDFAFFVSTSLLGSFLTLCLALFFLVKPFKERIVDLERRVFRACGYSKEVMLENFSSNKYVFVCNDGRVVDTAEECNKCDKEGGN